MVESVDIDNQSGFFICVHTWCKTCPFSHNVDNFFGSKQSLKITLSFVCTSTNAFMINVGETGRKLPPTIFMNIFNFWRKETKMHQNHIKLGAISSENMSAKQELQLSKLILFIWCTNSTLKPQRKPSWFEMLTFCTFSFSSFK